VQEPHRYYCPDGLHPSGEGYALWFATLVAQVPLTRFLGRFRLIYLRRARIASISSMMRFMRFTSAS
jgi:hypothetical protein